MDTLRTTILLTSTKERHGDRSLDMSVTIDRGGDGFYDSINNLKTGSESDKSPRAPEGLDSFAQSTFYLPLKCQH